MPLTEPGEPVTRRDLPGHVRGVLEAIGCELYVSELKKDDSPSAAGNIWWGGEDKLDTHTDRLITTLTNKFHGTLSDLMVTKLPVDDDWLEEYFKNNAGPVDRRTIRRFRLSIGLGTNRKSGVTSQLEVVMYPHENGKRIFVTNRKADRLGVTALIEQRAAESAARAASIAADNLAHPMSGGLPGLGNRR